MKDTDIEPAGGQRAEPGFEERDLEPLLEELALEDSHSVMLFGSRAQQQLTEVSDGMLERVRSKDAGPAGAALNEMVLTLRGFDVGDLDPNRKPGLIARLLGGAGRDAARLLQRYEKVRDQIDRICDELERRKTELLVDIESLDRLYAANLEYFRLLEKYIAAGELRLQRLEQVEIPALAAAAEASARALDAQKLRDLRGARDELERRVHDLRLTRQVTMQSLPSLRMVQENDKGLVNRITSTLVNTLPLWRQQLAQAVTIHRTREAAQTVTAATDLTNDLLRANAENLRQSNSETRRQLERGIYDVEAIAEANRNLIDTIEDSLRIAEQGRSAREQARTRLDDMERQLRASLAAARAGGQPSAPE